MSLRGARGLVRISIDPPCDIQTAMAIEAWRDPRFREPDFYRRVTGRDYPGEYGERASARRRGIKFEQSLYENGAARLRRVLAEFYRLPPTNIYVRNLEDEVGSGSRDLFTARLSRTRRILQDAVSGRSHPHLVIQPAFALPIGSGRFIGISPDFIIWDPGVEVYVPGEIKAFIVRDNETAPSDLDRARRQAAVEILALRYEWGRFKVEKRIVSRAVFIFSSPYGLLPAAPREEFLDGAEREIQRAIEAWQRVETKFARLRKTPNERLENLIEELTPYYQESCIGSCVMADVCAKRYQGTVSELGDITVDLLGESADSRRLFDLIKGAPPRTSAESVQAASLREIARALGLDTYIKRRSA